MNSRAWPALARGSGDDAALHLAVEDWLLDRPGHEACLYAWQAAPTVVLGRNQVAWRECAPGRLAAAGVAVARRVSGGGAVYHDGGNLNVALLLPRAGYARDAVLGRWVRALRALGLPAEVGGPQALLVAGRKVSGQAFAFRRERVLHHGTLLLRADLAALAAHLVPALPEVASHGVRSIPARVANLAEWRPDLTVAEVLAAFADACRDWLGDAPPPVACAPATLAAEVEAATGATGPGGAFAAVLARHRSWEWRLGHSPRFTLDLPPGATPGGATPGGAAAGDAAPTGGARVAAGAAALRLTIADGIVSDCEGPAADLARGWVGRRFHFPDLAAAHADAPALAWLAERGV